MARHSLCREICIDGIRPVRFEFRAGFQKHLGEWCREEFRSATQSISLGARATYGIAISGGRQDHDLALASLAYGNMLGHSWGMGHWYRGNPEFRLELLGRGQFSPGSDWLVGPTPDLLYDFATGTRWMPFLNTVTGMAIVSFFF